MMRSKIFSETTLPTKLGFEGQFRPNSQFNYIDKHRKVSNNFWEAGLLLLTPGVEVLSSSSPDTAAAAIIRRSSRTARQLDTSAPRQPHSAKTIICTQPPITARCPVLGCSDGVLFNHRVHLSPPLHCSSATRQTSGK